MRGKIDSLVVSDWGVEMPEDIDIEQLRIAIRQEQKLLIQYRDASGRESQRCILPIAMIYYIEVVVLAAWCEMREDFRHFRVDRIAHSELQGQYFRGSSKNLRQQWHEIQAR